MQNSSAKAPKNAERIKVHFDRGVGLTAQTKRKKIKINTSKQGEMVCIKFNMCFHFKAFLANCDTLDKIVQGLVFDTDGWKPLTNYWTLSFHWRVNKKHWQTRNSRHATVVWSGPCNGRRRKQRPHQSAERLEKLAKVQSLLRQYINSWEAPPTPHTPDGNHDRHL